LKSLHKLDADGQEIQNYKVTLHNNTITSMQVFVEAAEKFGFHFASEDLVNWRQLKPLLTFLIGINAISY
jgi:hypothetical protein